MRGNGCVAADFNGDGHTDLFTSTTAADDKLLWNNGNGTFTEGARAAGVVSFGWHSGAAVADVNGDGRPDLFVAGYTDINAPIAGLDRRLPDQPSRRPRPALPQRGQRRRTGAHGSARSASRPGSTEPRRPRARRGLHRRQRRRPPRPLRRQRRRPEPALPERAGRAARSASGFVESARRRAASPTRTPAWASPAATTAATASPTSSSATRAARSTPSTGTPPRRAAVRRRPPGVRRRLRHELHRLGRLVGRPQPRRHPRPRARQRRHPGHEPRRRTPGRSRCSATSAQARPGSSATPAACSGSATGPLVNGRGLAAADYDNDGTVDIAVNSIGGPLILLRNTQRDRALARGVARRLPPGRGRHGRAPERPQARARGPRGQQLPLLRGPARPLRPRRSDDRRPELVVRSPGGRTRRMRNVAADRLIIVTP